MGDIYDSTTYQPRKSVGHLLSRVRIEMLTALDRELEGDRRLAPLELSAAQFIIIANLASAEGPLSASDLCKGISYDAGAMTRMLDRLESKALIRRNRSAQDRRLMHLELTEEWPRRPTRACARSPSRWPIASLQRLHQERSAASWRGSLGRMLENTQGLPARATA